VRPRFVRLRRRKGRCRGRRIWLHVRLNSWTEKESRSAPLTFTSTCDQVPTHRFHWRVVSGPLGCLTQPWSWDIESGLLGWGTAFKFDAPSQMNRRNVWKGFAGKAQRQRSFAPAHHVLPLPRPARAAAARCDGGVRARQRTLVGDSTGIEDELYYIGSQSYISMGFLQSL
jgi:hypothetical protein